MGISVAWKHDGGGTWQHRLVPGITTATGGAYERASDPVLAFGPDGTAYLSVLLFDASDCRTAVAVLRSADGGGSWTAPSFVHRRTTCDYDDDKNWLVVDTVPGSPHRGRLFQFWTPTISRGPQLQGSPQVVRWSDDRGRSWSQTAYVTAKDNGTQNSWPMILDDASLVDTYFDAGTDRAPDAGPRAPARERRPASAVPRAGVRRRVCPVRWSSTRPARSSPRARRTAAGRGPLWAK